MKRQENNYAASKLVVGIDSRMKILLGAAASDLRIADNSFRAADLIFPTIAVSIVRIQLRRLCTKSEIPHTEV